MNQLLKCDLYRYGKNKKSMPKFQRYMRKTQCATNPITRVIYKCLFAFYRQKNLVEISADGQIGPGLYIGHPYCITINSKSILGSNINIHKGVTIGQENRGKRKGTPTIGNDVWIGINSTIVGNINIGDDVLIAPNTYVNCDIPSHSIAIGSPCVVKRRENATQGYIDRKYPPPGGVLTFLVDYRRVFGLLPCV